MVKIWWQSGGSRLTPFLSSKYAQIWSTTMIQHHTSAMNVTFPVKIVTIWVKNVQNVNLVTSYSPIPSAVPAFGGATNVHHQNNARSAISRTIGQIKAVNAFAVKVIFWLMIKIAQVAQLLSKIVGIVSTKVNAYLALRDIRSTLKPISANKIIAIRCWSSLLLLQCLFW